MEISKLSMMYFIACDRMHQIVDDLYEALHEELGEPLGEWEKVEEAMDGVNLAIYQELDLIKTAVHEHEDQRQEA
jgi:hypothetical protein